MNGLNSTEGPIIESKQIGASQDCWGCGCCYFFNPFKYFLQSAISIYANSYEVNKNGIEIKEIKIKENDGNDEEKRIIQIIINGFGRRIFGPQVGNVFPNPNDIKPEQIAYFIGQLMEAKDATNDDKLEVFKQLCNDCDDNDMKIIVYSASAGSFFALSSFLNNNKGKQEFFQKVVAKLFPDVKEEEKRGLQKQLQKLMKTIVEKATLVNPPGFLFHGDLNFGRERQSLAVGGGLLASEEYFINMIGEYLSGGFTLVDIIATHNVNYLSILKFIKQQGLDESPKLVLSSTADEAVFPFYYVAKFAEKLKDHNVGDNQKISKFVYKVMQYGDVKNADQIEKYYDEIFGESLTANKNTVKTLATNYLKIRDDYLSVQLEFNKSRKEEEYNKSRKEEGKEKGEKGFFQKVVATLFSNVEEEKQKLPTNTNSWENFQGKATVIFLTCKSLCNSPTTSSPTASLFGQVHRAANSSTTALQAL